MENDELQEYLSGVWRKARKTMDEADRLWNTFIDLEKQIHVDYYAAKTLKQKIKTGIKDAIEYAYELNELLHELNDKINGDTNGEGQTNQKNA